MKKIFAILAAALLIASCGSDSKDDNNSLPVGTTNYKGTMTVVFQGQDVPTENVVLTVNYDQKKGNVVLTVNYDQKKGQASILFNQVKFVPQMPVTLDITVPGVTATVSGEKVNLSAEGVEPAVGGVPYEDYLVTGLNGSIYKGVLDISLKFGNFPTKFNGTLIE